MEFPSEYQLLDRFVSSLPGDPSDAPHPRQVFGACYSRVAPTPVAAPKLIAHASEVAALLDLSEADCRKPGFAEVFAGNRALPGSVPYAACYGGHQFGHWAGQLGDGRAITLGERKTRAGQRLELQLKGAGRTPYSRSADGRAVMRSSVREFLCSEAMHHLGVPTTRALCLVATGESVTRDMLYDGNVRDEPGAIVCRVSPSFLRFGNYQILSARDDVENLRRLLDFTLSEHFPELGTPNRPAYLSWYETVCRRTVEMVVHWMRVGFVHGVMNTDNMSVLGLTIDYGPYGFLEPFEPGWTPNTTDAHGRRYRYGQQPQIALWNLARLAEALMPLIEMPGPLEEILQATIDQMQRDLQVMWLAKLGLRERPELSDDDRDLVESLHNLLQLTETDMTLFFRGLSDVPLDQPSTVPQDGAGRCGWLAPLTAAYYDPEALRGDVAERLRTWLDLYAARLRAEGLDAAGRRARMNAVNPKYIPRNYLAQLAIDKAEAGDGSLVLELLDTLTKPYDDQPARDAFAARRPEWARERVGCSMLSCSS